MGRHALNQSFYTDFIDHCNSVIETDIKELHTNVAKLHYLYSEIIKHIDILNRYSIKITNPVYNIVSIDLDGSNIKYLDVNFVKLLRLYNYIAIIKPNKLITRINLYTLFAKLDRVTYDRYLKMINHTNINHIVKGGKYCFNYKVGSIQIVKTKRNGTGAVNRSKTNETYKAILDANLTPKTIENPNGIPYIIRHGEGDIYYKWNYCRNRDLLCQLNKEYMFVPNRTEHSVSQNEHLSKQEVYNSSMSGVVKMFVLMRIDPTYHTRYMIQHKDK